MRVWFSRIRNGLLRSRAGLAALVMIALAAVFAGALGVRAATHVEHEVGFTELVSIAEAGNAGAVHVDGDRFVVKDASGGTQVAVVDDAVARHELVQLFAKHGVPL